MLKSTRVQRKTLFGNLYSMHVFIKYQQAISRFRVSSYRISIELGRHKKTFLPVDKRLCQFCSSRKVDDEYHFHVHCGFHAVGRKILYSTAHQVIKIN